MFLSYLMEKYTIFQELRNQLTKKGIKFSTKSDTEVILEGYRYWGIDALTKFEGMFRHNDLW